MKTNPLKKLLFVLGVLAVPLAENIVYHFVSTGRFIVSFSFVIHPAVSLIYTVLTVYFFYRLLQQEHIKLEFNLKLLLANIPLFLGLLYATDLRNQAGSSSGLLALRAALCLGTLLTSHLIFLPLKQARHVVQSNIKEIGTVVLSILPILILQSQLAHSFWTIMAKPTGYAVSNIMSTLGFYAVPIAGDAFVKIRNPTFGLKIVEECSGFDGICLFLFVFFLTMRIWNKKTATSIFFLGIGYMLLVNILRIAGIYAATLVSIKYAGARIGYALFTNFFHTHAGWIVYLIALTLFFLVAARYRSDSPKLAK